LPENTMAQAVEVVDLLKAALKARGITYAELARRVGQSEASVKRWFAQRNFTLARLDTVCEAVGVDFAELTGGFDREARLISRLTVAQEREIVSEPKLFLAALSALNLLGFEDMLALYEFERAELIGLLARLDRIGFIELMPNNRIRLRVARTFSWTPNGPIMEAFKDNVADFFASDFAGAGEAMFLLNGRLTPGARHALAERLKKLAREFAELHWDEGALPQSERQPVSLLLACRPWQVEAIRPFIRATPQRKPR